MSGRRASYAASRARIGAALWMAFSPRHDRAECARAPVVVTATRSVPLAACLDDGVGRLHQDREVALEQVGTTLREQLEPVVRRVDLLGLVEQVGHVVLRLRHRRRQLEDDGVAALHVAGAEPAQHVAVERGGPVVVDGHGVEVTGHQDPLRPAQVGAGDHAVAVPGHLQVGQRPERPLDLVGDLLLVAAHRLDVDQRCGQAHDVRDQDRCGHPAAGPSRARPASGMASVSRLVPGRRNLDAGVVPR